VVDSLRAEGVRAGLVKIRSYRPFPVTEVQAVAAGVRSLAVLDRNCSFGMEGAMAADVKAALYGMPNAPLVRGFIAGLGGRDLRPEDLREIFNRTLAAGREGGPPWASEFLGVQQQEVRA
jgi:pyruvate ferredoxin oxidoreductase alpha subunit